MMQIPSRLNTLLILFVLALPLSAQAKGETIAIVDVQYILEESNAGRIARGLLEQNTKKARERIEAMKQNLETLQQQYEAQKSILAPDARAQLEQNIVEKQLELRQDLQKSQLDLQTRDAELTGAILEEIKPIIEDIAKTKKLTLVVEKGEAGVLFVSDPLDLTQIVLQKYDASKQKAK